jgi:cell wall-associated NlpC family hydrolase
MISIVGPVRRKALGLGVVCGLVLAGGAGFVVLGPEPSSSAAGPAVEASIEDWRWAPSDELPAAPKPEENPEPAADAEESEPAEEQTPERDPKPTRPATSGSARPDDLPSLSDAASAPGDDVLVKAEVLKNGVALPPLEAPPEVRAIFEAGNTIARSPYKWGGGHGKWQDNGYDCSGSVSYALAAAGLLNTPLASGPLMRWGKPGKGKWITLYSNPGHVFMVVAGVRFDTVARGQTGSRWINSMTDTSGYVARHPEGF